LGAVISKTLFGRVTKRCDVMLNGVKYLVVPMQRRFLRARFFDCGLIMTRFCQAVLEN